MKKQRCEKNEFVPMETGPVSKIIVQDWHLFFITTTYARF
jgi:hypothetical protein